MTTPSFSINSKNELSYIKDKSTIRIVPVEKRLADLSDISSKLSAELKKMGYDFPADNYIKGYMPNGDGESFTLFFKERIPITCFDIKDYNKYIQKKPEDRNLIERVTVDCFECEEVNGKQEWYFLLYLTVDLTRNLFDTNYIDCSISHLRYLGEFTENNRENNEKQFDEKEFSTKYEYEVPISKEECFKRSVTIEKSVKEKFELKDDKDNIIRLAINKVMSERSDYFPEGKVTKAQNLILMYIYDSRYTGNMYNLFREIKSKLPEGYFKDGRTLRYHNSDIIVKKGEEKAVFHVSLPPKATSVCFIKDFSVLYMDEFIEYLQNDKKLFTRDKDFGMIDDKAFEVRQKAFEENYRLKMMREKEAKEEKPVSLQTVNETDKKLTSQMDFKAKWKLLMEQAKAEELRKER